MKTLSAKDFRIGNFIFYNGNLQEIGIITAIKKELIPNIEYVEINHRTDLYYQIKHIRPIPLTVDLIENLVEIEKNKYLVQGMFIFIWKEDDEKWFVLASHEHFFLREIEYYHEYQNLIFSLIGKEITLEL